MSSSLTSSNLQVSSGSNSLSIRNNREIINATTGDTQFPHNLNSQFREIHKNTWLKRLTAEGKKITVGPKKSERSWVVFCVHDDTEALLEGYAEPKQAANHHNPEWIVPLKDTLHISHALIPNSQEFEFVVTLSSEVVHFHAISWNVMHEWVETLRSKLREMKIISPRENLYTKLPEIRPPLLPTRDPTSPLPAPPPVPAALVPGVERVITQNTIQTVGGSENESNTNDTTSNSLTNFNNCINISDNLVVADNSNVTRTNTQTTVSTSNTVIQNVLNTLFDPISTHNEQVTTENKYITNINSNESQSNDNTQQNFLWNTDDNKEIYKPTGLDTMHRSSIEGIQNIATVSDGFLIRPQTSRSLSAGAADKFRHFDTSITPFKNDISSSSSNNITKLEVNPDKLGNDITDEFENTNRVSKFLLENNDDKANITIIQVHLDTNSGNTETPIFPKKNSKPEIFKFPEIFHPVLNNTSETTKQMQHEYKSNVEIIPSNTNCSTIQVLSNNSVSSNCNPYVTEVIKNHHTIEHAQAIVPFTELNINTQKTTVHVTGREANITPATTSEYGTCYTKAQNTFQSTPKMSKKIILSANSYGITNITVNNSARETVLMELTDNNIPISIINDTSRPIVHNKESFHYPKVLSSHDTAVVQQLKISSRNRPLSERITEIKTNSQQTNQSNKINQHLCKFSDQSVQCNYNTDSTSLLSDSESKLGEVHCSTTTTTSASALTSLVKKTPNMARRCIGFPTANLCTSSTSTLHNLPLHPRFTRGSTENVITLRHSRKDFYFLQVGPKNNKSSIHAGLNKKNLKTNVNNNFDIVGTSSSCNNSPMHAGFSRISSMASKQHRRSSSTSDTHAHCNASNQNNNSAGNETNAILTHQLIHTDANSVSETEDSCCRSALSSVKISTANKRTTLREQQVQQLRKEIMHPGGVRLQLRRKDCIGSIAWIDAFGAIWVAGWKQKEHPVLYNALHIGDQLLSIAGVKVISASEVNKIIRNVNTVFIEVLVRRTPFGRAYAIRREREGQCLGLIRDGNSSTIVDVVPNSLSARYGLPPKAPSCDSSTLTFWVLTEINGRPLNLFFKDNEIRDRLNSVGRDISILVQPSDLIAKLKKQLKLFRGYKDYLVQ